MLTKTRKTRDDYLRLGDEVRAELIDGEIYMTPAPRDVHQLVVGRLYALLLTHADRTGCGRVIVSPFDCHLSETDIVQPDVLFVSAQRLHLIKDWLFGPPDLAVEVLSPTHEERARIVKRDLYRRFGVREYWIVDPSERTIEALELLSGEWHLRGIYQLGDTMESVVLPGLALRLVEAFRDL